MSVSIRSCPGCDALILADTFQCPDCGHVFDEQKAEKLRGVTELATAEVEDPCPDCGHMVRAGLVRCPECGKFMRDDIAKKFDAMQQSPQKIIYSDVPADQRTDYLPPRTGDKQTGPILDAAEDEDGFTLTGGPAPAMIPDESEEGGFELGPGSGDAVPAPAASDAQTEAARTVDDPRKTTDKDGAAADAPAADSQAADASESGAADGKTEQPTGPAAGGKVDIDIDGLLDIARQDEKETSRRRIERRRQDKARSILVPCGCGAWIRVREHQTGRNVRCRKCNRILPIPQLTKKKGGEETQNKEVDVPWLRDVDYVTVDPGNLRLKAGSVSGNATPVDVLMTEAGVAVCTLVGQKAKSSLFAGKGNADAASEKRETIQEFLNSGGSISGAPSEKTVFVPADRIEELMIVQPVQKAHESMFAGVPVFGEGRIAVRVPAGSEATQEQQFLSFGLTDFRFFATHLKELYGLADFGKDQGVPAEDKKTALKCHYTGMILNALTDTEYHEHDRHIELTLIGRKCGACGIAVSEESRKKQKIGGASGRGLSRAKCPKCNGKFGNNSLYTFEVKDTAPKMAQPEAEEADESAPAENTESQA